MFSHVCRVAEVRPYRDDKAESCHWLPLDIVLSFVLLCLTLPRAEPYLLPLLVSYIIPSESFGRSSHSSRLLSSPYRIMLALDTILRISTVILALDTALASHQTLVQRAVDNLHLEANRRSNSLAKDLRVAFGGIFPRALTSGQSGYVVYCKPSRQVPLSGGSGGGGEYNGTSIIGTRTSPTTHRPTSTETSTSSSPTVTSPWKLIDSHSGSNFFDGWDFYTGSDPTNGIVDFINQNTAHSAGLLEVNSAGNAVMRVETTPNVSGNRKSIRIATQTGFNGGLVIMDAVHMPTGCGVWPAFWTDGPNWPNGGEIDIVEGVNDYTNNQATVHTNTGCNLASSNATSLSMSGSVIGGTDCSALNTGNQGCGIRAGTGKSFGPGFNSNGGGVYAMKWDTTGIAVYFFPRGSIPADITAETPLPDSWGQAQARWPAVACDPFKFFNNHHAIFDTTLCGDWAAGVWTAAGIPGQEQSCAQRTGVSTCAAFVRANGASMQEAYWEVTSVKIYQQEN